MKTIAQMAIAQIDTDLAQLNAVQPLTEDQYWDRRFDPPITEEGEPISHEEWEAADNSPNE